MGFFVHPYLKLPQNFIFIFAFSKTPTYKALANFMDLFKDLILHLVAVLINSEALHHKMSCMKKHQGKYQEKGENK